MRTDLILDGDIISIAFERGWLPDGKTLAIANIDEDWCVLVLAKMLLEYSVATKQHLDNWGMRGFGADLIDDIEEVIRLASLIRDDLKNRAATS